MAVEPDLKDVEDDGARSGRWQRTVTVAVADGGGTLGTGAACTIPTAMTTGRSQKGNTEEG